MRLAYCDDLFKHGFIGVILSTAFIHLMQEGFESLNNPCLYGRWKDWTGAVVYVLPPACVDHHNDKAYAPYRLFSFLAIFLVECKSRRPTAHVFVLIL
jgi:hypothetical protein